MSSVDLTTILGNISLSLLPVESLVLGLGYLVGILFVVSGLIKFTKISKQSQERVSVPIAFVLGGVALIYLPSSVQVLSSTLFGSSSILQYTPQSTFSIYNSVAMLIQAGGLIWFVRGTVLVMHAAEPGKQHGIKGLMFIIAGILSVNFNYTVQTLNTMFAYFMAITMKVV